VTRRVRAGHRRELKSLIGHGERLGRRGNAASTNASNCADGPSKGIKLSEQRPCLSVIRGENLQRINSEIENGVYRRNAPIHSKGSKEVAPREGRCWRVGCGKEGDEHKRKDTGCKNLCMGGGGVLRDRAR